MNEHASHHPTPLGRIVSVAVILLSGTLHTACNRHPELQILAEDVPTAHALRAEAPAVPKTIVGGLTLHFSLDKYEVMTKKAYQDLANGSGVYDLILDYNTGLAPYVRNRYVYTLDDIKSTDSVKSMDFSFEKDLFRSAWEEVGWYGEGQDATQGKAVAFPFAANTMVLCYNRRLFDDPVNQRQFRTRYKSDLRPPATWEELRRIAEFFTRPDHSTYGIAMQGDPYFIYYEWANVAYSMGGGVMKKRHGWQGDEFTPVILDSPETVRATEYYLALRRFNASPDFFATDAIKQRDEVMRKGNVAMAIMWSDVLFDLVRSDSGATFGFVPIPGNVSMLAGGSFYVNRHSEHPTETMKLILYFLGKDLQMRLLRNGLCSPLRTAYTREVRDTIPYADALYNSLDRGVYMLEAGPDAEAVISIVGKTLQELWRDTSGLSVQSALRSAKREIEDKRGDIFKKLRSAK